MVYFFVAAGVDGLFSCCCWCCWFVYLLLVCLDVVSMFGLFTCCCC